MNERLALSLLFLALSVAGAACDDGGGAAHDVATTAGDANGDVQDATDGSHVDGSQTLPDGSSAGTCNPTATPFGGGDGTAADPHLVCTPAHWGALGADRDVHYRLASDLDFEGVSYVPVAVFGGLLDGGGHTVRNVDYAGDEAALFLRLVGATIRDLRVADVALRGRLRAATVALDACLPVRGAGQRCTIERVHVTGATVSADASSLPDAPSAQAGGLFETVQLATIEDVSFEGQVTGDIAAGAFRRTQQAAQVRRVRVDATVTGTGEAAGLAAFVSGSQIEGAAVHGATSGGRVVGGLFGDLTGAPTVSDVYSTMDLTLTFETEVAALGVFDTSYRVAGAVATPRFGSGLAGSLSRFYFGGTIAVASRPPWVTELSDVVTAGLFACWGGYTGCAGEWVGDGCYWDAETSGQAEPGGGRATCIGLSSAELRTPAETPELAEPAWVKTDGALPALSFE